MPRNGFVREYPLNRHADLTGMIEATLGQRRYGTVEIGALRQDHRGRAAMFQRAAGAGGELRPQGPADLGRADEAEEADARIGHQRGGILAVRRHHGLRPGFRQSGLMQDLHEVQARQRGLVRRLHDHRATGRDRRRHLVRDQVERMVEGTDRDHDTNRLLPREGNPVLGALGDAHGDHLPRTAAQFVDADVHGIDGPVDLDQGIGQRLAAFARGLDGHALAPVAQDRHGTGQDLHPLPHRDPGVAVPIEVKGVAECLFHRGTVRTGDTGNRCPVPRRGDDDITGGTVGTRHKQRDARQIRHGSDPLRKWLMCSDGAVGPNRPHPKAPGIVYDRAAES